MLVITKRIGKALDEAALKDPPQPYVVACQPLPALSHAACPQTHTASITAFFPVSSLQRHCCLCDTIDWLF